MQGRRVYPNESGQILLSPGDHGQHPETGEWLARPPSCHAGGLKNHEVTEHGDGTITVSPSILIDDGVGGKYHGWLERGVWREAG